MTRLAGSEIWEHARTLGVLDLCAMSLVLSGSWCGRVCGFFSMPICVCVLVDFSAMLCAAVPINVCVCVSVSNREESSCAHISTVNYLRERVARDHASAASLDVGVTQHPLAAKSAHARAFDLRGVPSSKTHRRLFRAPPHRVKWETQSGTEHSWASNQ